MEGAEEGLVDEEVLTREVEEAAEEDEGEGEGAVVAVVV